MLEMRQDKNCRGISVLELLIVATIGIVLFAIALPALDSTVKNYRISGDARNIADQLGVARLRSGGNFTDVRINFNLANGTYVREFFNKSNSTWSAEGGTQYLSKSIYFGYGTITAAAGSQSTISQPPAVGNPAVNVIVFNSRGIPIDNSGNPTGSYAIYLNDGGKRYYAVSVYSTGKMRRWRYDNGSSSWIQY
jgi:Tfp pilus assembly protein FimT